MRTEEQAHYADMGNAAEAEAHANAQAQAEYEQQQQTEYLELATTLDQFKMSRTGIDLFSDAIIRAVKSGLMNPLELRAICKSMEMILERVNKETQTDQLTEADKYPETKFSAFGVEFTKGDVSTRYDYSVCNDPTWNQLKRVLDSGNEQLKEREAFLKQVKKAFTELDEGSGELVTISPPKVMKTAGLKVSIK